MRTRSICLRVVLPAAALACCLAAARAQDAAQDSTALRDAGRRIASAVAVITGEDVDGRPIAAGSGFFVRRSVMLTDYNVVKDAVKIHVQLGGQETKEARIFAADEAGQFALMSVDGVEAEPLDYPCFPYMAVPGSKAYVGRDPSSITQITIAGTLDPKSPRYILQGAPLTDADSGAPILNDLGEVMGHHCQGRVGPPAAKRIGGQRGARLAVHADAA
jgi:hypothetical protein